MTDRKSTKRALISGAFAILMCAAMLIGTTFAWFTDTSSTAVNKIQAGTLKVDIVKEDGETSIKNESMSFVNKDGSADILWEPGATFMTPAFKIKSTGSLALKYKLTLNGITGDNMLLKVVKFSVVKADGTEVDLDTFEGHLTPDAALSVIWMRLLTTIIRIKLSEVLVSPLLLLSGHMKRTARTINMISLPNMMM